MTPDRDAGSARALPTEEEVRKALSEVVDPEAGLNIVDLGLVYGVEIDASGVRVRMTMTSAACPMTAMIVEDVEIALERLLPPDLPVVVDLVWDPPWTPDRLSERARETFGWRPGR